MIVYGVASAEAGAAVELVVRRKDAERLVAEIHDDELDGATAFPFEDMQLGGEWQRPPDGAD